MTTTAVDESTVVDVPAGDACSQFCIPVLCTCSRAAVGRKAMHAANVEKKPRVTLGGHVVQAVELGE